jgi:L-ascorbate metabolism protein UlaG (beta-lactamase superfamily)
MFPEQTAQVARDLNAKVLMPVHWGKFVLALHSWTEPIERALVKGAELGQDIITPMIGEVVRVGENTPNSKWWRDF